MDISMLRTHLGDELYEQVEEKLGSLDGFHVIPTNDGSWLPKSKLDAEIDKRKTLQTTINGLTTELNDAKKRIEESSTLQTKVDKLTKDLEDRDKSITQMKRSGKIRDALVKAKVRDASIVEKLLDGDKIGEDDKGNLTGLDEQLKALQETSGYLFDTNQPARRAGFDFGSHAGNGGGHDDHSDVNAAIRAAARR